LSWAGLLAVLAVALFWLPLAPQAVATPDEPEEQLGRRADDERERKIAELRRELRELEGPARSADRKADPEEVERAKREFDERARDVEAKRRDLRQAEQRLDEAKRRIARLEGRVTAEIRLRPGEAVTAPRAVIARPAMAPIAPGVPSAAVPPPARPAIAATVPVRPGTPAIGGRVVRPAGAAPAEEMMDRLGRRLEDLAKEIEELRREMRRGPAEGPSRRE
jgi:hypothetical protein